MCIRKDGSALLTQRPDTCLKIGQTLQEPVANKTNRKTDKQKKRQTEKQKKEKKTNKQTKRQTDRYVC